MADPMVIQVGTLDELNGALAFVDRATSGSYVIKLTADIREGTSALLANGGTQLTYPGGLKDASNSTQATSIVDGVAQPIPVPPRQDLYALNLNSGVTVTIDGTNTAPNGANFTIDGRNSSVTPAGVVTQGTTPTYRGLFVYAGQVTLSDLTIQNVLARGGNGSGGGAGLGGGLFVAGTGKSSGTGKAANGAVTLSDVVFQSNMAAGGSGGMGGGGGGLGGTGGAGGGGIGGDSAVSFSNGRPGIILGARGGGSIGGSQGGNFGGGGTASGQVVRGTGGGVPDDLSLSSSDGGFGGGGGYMEGQGSQGGRGGFGGGGGIGVNGSAGKAGGFGGGGGGIGSGSGGPAGAGGFGGGNGDFGQFNNGGGGLGAGADVFVQQGGTLKIVGGTLGAGTVMGGSGATAGAALGSGIFIQGNQSVTLNPGAGQTTTVSGVIADEAGSQPQLTTGQGTDTGTNGTGDDQGSLVVGVAGTPGGLVTLAPVDGSGNAVANTYTGGTALNAGTLELAAQGAAGTASGGQTAGGVAFGATGTTLQIDGQAFTQPQDGNLLTARYRVLATVPTPNYAAPVTNFAPGETLDLAGLQYDGDAIATYDGTSRLTVRSGGDTETLSQFFLAGGTVPAGYQFTTSVDASGTGTDVMLTLIPTTPGGSTPAPAPAAVNPTISGTYTTTDTAEQTVRPFGASAAGGPVVIGDTNSGATDGLAITLTGGGGTLSGAGLTGGGNSYALAMTDPTTLTNELDALAFMPANGTPGATVNTTFTLTATSSAGTSATDSKTVVSDTAAPATATPTPVAPAPAPGPTDAVAISPQVAYADGVFTLTGTASSTAGVARVEIFATVDDGTQPQPEDLGSATVDPNTGTFTFKDPVGNQQSFFQAKLTDNAGGTATSADPGFNLKGGIGPRGAEGRQNSFSPTEQVSSTLFLANGLRQVTLQAPGQTADLQPYDTVFGARQGGTTFVYTPGGETGAIDVIRGFKAGGGDHDVLSLPGADFGNSIANVLRNTGDVGGSAFVTDPVTGDAIRLAGVSTAELKRKDFTFHA